jgi:hypothetical protein
MEEYPNLCDLAVILRHFVSLRVQWTAEAYLTTYLDTQSGL